MDIQEMINAKMAEMRVERMANSDQLTLGEFILKLKMVDENKPIFYDFGQRPAGASSWRGSYCELALEYSKGGGGGATVNSDKEDEYSSPEYRSYEQDTFDLPEDPKVKDIIAMCDFILNKEMVGYKGGNFKMHKNVAVFVANYGESGISDYNNEDYPSVGVFDVVESDDTVVILTKTVEY